jgi:outer membrane usher protein
MPSWKSLRKQVSLLASFSLFAVTCCFSAEGAIDAPANLAGVQGAEFQPLLLMVDINRQKLDDTVLILKDRQGALYAAEKDLQNWRMRIPGVPPVSFKGARYYPLSALPGIIVKSDEATQSLNIEVKPETFMSTVINASRTALPPPIPPSPGMFFNYDVIAERSNGFSSGSGLFEVGAFNAFGTGLTSFALRDGGNGERSSIRLDTSFTIDRPERVASFRLGDTVSRPAGIWGSAVRFGGVQYSTNFATQPGLITVPIQTFSGQAALPSTVDVYVNNVFATRRQVAPGPFSISDLPVVTGAGDVNIVVRDLLGREQAITQPFYASPGLLRKGLQDFSFELGALRENFGIRSNDYGARFGAGTYRAGLTDYLTGEGHMEWQEGGQATVGLSAATLFPSLGTLNTSAATSRSNAGRGRLWAIGFDRQTPIVSFGMRTQLADDNFRQLGFVDGFPAPRRLTSVNAGLALGQPGSVGAAYIRQDVPGRDRAEVVSISYGLPLQRMGAFSISAFKSLRGGSNHSISISWAMPLDAYVNTSLTHIASNSSPSQTQLQAQRSLPSADGYGYRFQAGRNVPQQAALLLQNRIGTYTLEAANFQGQSSARIGVSGGVAVLGGSAFLSRRIIDSFGLVQIPGMDNVRVYVDNQLAAQTDRDGNALLPRLRPYDNNPVRVEHMDLRMDTQIRSLTMNPVPYARSGVVIRFPIERSYGALMRLVSEDGKPLPAGSVVELEGQDTQFPVAMDGAVYITGLKAVNRLRTSWAGKYCALSVPFEESAKPVPNLGTFTCKAE